MHTELAEPVIDCPCHIFNPLRFPYVAERKLADSGDRRRVMWETPRRLFGLFAS